MMLLEGMRSRYSSEKELSSAYIAKRYKPYDPETIHLRFAFRGSDKMNGKAVNRALKN